MRCDPVDYSLPGSSVHGVLRAGMGSLEWSGAGSHSLLQGTLPTHGSDPCLLWLLHWPADSSRLSRLGLETLVGSSYITAACLLQAETNTDLLRRIVSPQDLNDFCKYTYLSN